MIDRTDFDLRLAAHRATTARVDRREWQRQGTGTAAPVRAALASALIRLARRLTPELPAGAATGQPERSQPAAA
jgi:hypothetical protein